MFTLTQAYTEVGDAITDLVEWHKSNSHVSFISSTITANPYAHGVVLIITYRQ
jgi:hypothetical protein